METEKVVVEMTQEELAEYHALKKKKEEADAKAKKEADVEAYKVLCEEMVEQMFPKLMELSEKIHEVKVKTLEAFSSLIETKAELYGVSNKQRSHAFMSSDKNKRITIGYYKRDAWDDTVGAGIEKVKQYLNSLASDAKSQELVQIILDLLNEDDQGNLKADKVLQLQSYADKSDSELFKDGVQIIRESYSPIKTKVFIRVEYRNPADGAWKNVPLGVTEVK